MILRIYKINKQTGFLESFPNSTLQAEMYSFEYDCKRMGEAPTITGTIMYPLCLDNYWTEDVCVEFKGERYFIENIPSSSYSNQDARYKHDITFVSERKKLEKTYFKDRLNTRNKKAITDFSFFGDLSVFVAKLNECMGMFNDATGYTVVIDPNIETEEKNIVIENMYILEALQHAVEEYGVPYYIQGKEIHFGECQNEISTPLKYGVDNALLSIQRNNTNEVIINRITGVGSSENIPYYYPNFNESGEHEVTTEPAEYADRIKLNYLKIDPYTRLRDGGSAVFRKGCPSGFGYDIYDYMTIHVLEEGDKIHDGYSVEEITQYVEIKKNGDQFSLLNIDTYITPKIRDTKYINLNLVVGGDFKNFSVDILKLTVYTLSYINGEEVWTEMNSSLYENNKGTLVIDNKSLAEIKVSCVYKTTYDINWGGGQIRQGGNMKYSYDTNYYTSSRNLRVYADDGTFDDTEYFDFNKVFDYKRKGIKSFSKRITYTLTRIVAPYSNCYFDSRFKAVFNDKAGDNTSEWHYFKAETMTLKDSDGNDYTDKCWFNEDSKYYHFRNHTSSNMTITATMSALVEIETETKAYGVELEYLPDFGRQETPYDHWKFHDGDEVAYSVAGIKFENTDIPEGLKVIFSPTINWIDPKQNLMPSKYRQTLGEEMFYEADNNTYKDDKGVFITFPNPYRPIKRSELIAETKEDIKPTIVGVRNARGERIDMFADIAFDENDNNDRWEEVDENTEELVHSFFFVKLRKTDGADGFNLFEQAIESGEMTISMTTGHCGSCNFVIAVDEETQKNLVQVDENGDLVRDDKGNVRLGSPQDRQQDTQNNEVWIALRKSEDDYGIILPDKAGGLVPTTDDKFVITNILLPNQYITKAEERLEKELLAEMLDKNDDKFEYSIDLSRIFLAENEDIANALNENSAVTIQYNGINHRMYVSSYSYKMDSENPLPNIKIEISKELTITKNKLQVLEDRVIKKVEYISANATQNVSNERGGGGKSDIKVVQETGYDTKAVMSQKAVTKAIEQVAYDNQPISVSQTTGFSTTSVMSQRAVTMELSNISSEMNSKVIQTTGGTTNGWMSQKAVTDALTLAKPTFDGIETSVKYVTTTDPYDSYDGSVVYISSDKRFAYKVESLYYRIWHSSAMYNTTAPKALTNTIFKNTSNNQDYIFDGADLVLLTTSNGSSGTDITISQTTGDSTTSVMSQKAVTEAVNSVDKVLHFDGFVEDATISLQTNPYDGGKIYFVKSKNKFAYYREEDGIYTAMWNGFTKYATFVAGEGVIPNSNVIFIYNGELYLYNDGTLNSINKNCIDITYSELKSLVDNDNLFQGMQYRITDYVTTCNIAGSVSGVTTSSANHQFDIIVTADTNSALNANVRVCLHEGDTYFAKNNLSEWVVKYDIKNDTTKYKWAQTTDGRGVIYYMCDEFGNECAYDFKNILFNNGYTFDYYGTDYSLQEAKCYENKIKGYYSSNQLILNNNVFKNTKTWNNRNNSLAMNCYSNTFKNACSDIKLGIFCYNNKFASISSNITFGDNCINNELDTARSYFKNIVLENGCSYNKITTSKATDSSNIPQNLHVLSGVSGTISAINTITLNTVNNSYITKVAKNSSGVIKMYNEADLVG